MGLIVICAFRPKPGKEQDLLNVIKEHVPILRKLGLATDRANHIMKAQDGTIVEVFEWKSQQAIDEAHSHPAVLDMWKKFEACCEYIPFTGLDESKNPFSHFTPVDF